MNIEELVQRAAKTGAIEGMKLALGDSLRHGTGPLLYSAEAAGDVLGCSAQSVHRLVKTGLLRAVWDGPGRGMQISRMALVDYFEALDQPSAMRRSMTGIRSQIGR